MIFINILRTGTSILTCLIFLLLIPLRGGSIMPARKTPPDWKQIFSTQRELFCVSVSSSSFKIWSDHPFNVVSISLLQNYTHFQGTSMPDFGIFKITWSEHPFWRDKPQKCAFISFDHPVFTICPIWYSSYSFQFE